MPEIASRDYFIIDRNSWIGLGLYTSVFLAAASSYGSIASENHIGSVQPSKWTGTLIVGDSALLENNVGYNPELLFHHRKRGALTLRRNRANDFALSIQRPSGKPSSIHRIVFDLPELPTASTDFASGSPITFSEPTDAGLTAQNIALGTQNSFADEGITPVPEPGTWFAAALVAGVVAWSQGRRFGVAFGHSERR